MFTWPENIVPLPAADFAAENESSVIRSKMETGRFRQRRRFTAEHETARLTFDLTDNEYSMFKAIWKYKLLNGSNWFTIRLPVGDGNTLTLVEVRFIANYRANHAPFANWSVSAPIEFKESSSVSEDVLDVIIDDGYDTSEFEDAAQETYDEAGHMTAQHPFE